jgi:hypothetical protein
MFAGDSAGTPPAPWLSLLDIRSFHPIPSILLSSLRPITNKKKQSARSRAYTMPPVRTAGRNRKPPPPGFEDIEDTLLEFSNKMKDAQADTHEGKKRHETLWPIMQISHQRKSPNSPPTNS